MKALEMVAPGTALREGIDNDRPGADRRPDLIGDPEELTFLFSGGIKLDDRLLAGRCSTRWRRWTARSS